MGKTALELTPEELRQYRPWSRYGSNHDPQRWEQAWGVAHAAARLLREQFEATRVMVFGSVVRGDLFTTRSDIDMAVWGVPPERFFEAAGCVLEMTVGFEVNLAPGEGLFPWVAERVAAEGVDL